MIEANRDHIIEELVANFIANLPAEEVYHAAQARGFTWGAVRAPEALVDDAHLHDRGFWKQVEHPELGRSFVYPGEAAIYNGSPWRISRRAPLIGEHNQDIFCGELGLSLPRTLHAGGKSSDLGEHAVGSTTPLNWWDN